MISDTQIHKKKKKHRLKDKVIRTQIKCYCKISYKQCGKAHYEDYISAFISLLVCLQNAHVTGRAQM